ncbi:double zinc ribbon domain-containing protein [Natronorubrum sp. DTA7]|uniref:double zinc ribbon domain-containing protein n=1 Tax=Natronorubrum sp. DTA7 TaxID=3447016 RepID=UPI003F8362D3
MSKITFRADDDLVEQLERLDVSKSEAMREALRAYLDGSTGADRGAERASIGEPESTGAIDDLIRTRVDELLADRLHEYGLDETRRQESRARGRNAGDVTISVSLEDDRRLPEQSARDDQRIRTDTHARGDDHAGRSDGTERPAREDADEPRSLEDEPVSQCNQCGEHVDDDHVYCPNCGEKTSRRLFCDCGDEIRSDWAFCPGCGRRTPAADVLGRDSHT